MNKFIERVLDVAVILGAIYFALLHFAPDTLNDIISVFTPNSDSPEQVVINLSDKVAKGDGKAAVNYLYIDERLSENEKNRQGLIMQIRLNNAFCGISESIKGILLRCQRAI